MIEKRLELIPIGLEETIQNFKKSETKKIIWREIGFIKYFEVFKKMFSQFKKLAVELRPTSLRWIMEFLDVLKKTMTQIIEFDKELQKALEQ